MFSTFGLHWIMGTFAYLLLITVKNTGWTVLSGMEVLTFPQWKQIKQKKSSKQASFKTKKLQSCSSVLGPVGRTLLLTQDHFTLLLYHPGKSSSPAVCIIIFPEKNWKTPTLKSLSRMLSFNEQNVFSLAQCVFFTHICIYTTFEYTVQLCCCNLLFI